MIKKYKKGMKKDNKLNPIIEKLLNEAEKSGYFKIVPLAPLPKCFDDKTN